MHLLGRLGELTGLFQRYICSRMSCAIGESKERGRTVKSVCAQDLAKNRRFVQQYLSWQLLCKAPGLLADSRLQ